MAKKKKKKKNKLTFKKNIPRKSIIFLFILTGFLVIGLVTLTFKIRAKSSVESSPNLTFEEKRQEVNNLIKQTLAKHNLSINQLATNNQNYQQLLANSKDQASLDLLKEQILNNIRELVDKNPSPLPPSPQLPNNPPLPRNPTPEPPQPPRTPNPVPNPAPNPVPTPTPSPVPTPNPSPAPDNPNNESIFGPNLKIGRVDRAKMKTELSVDLTSWTNPRRGLPVNYSPATSRWTGEEELSLFPLLCIRRKYQTNFIWGTNTGLVYWETSSSCSIVISDFTEIEILLKDIDDDISHQRIIRKIEYVKTNDQKIIFFPISLSSCHVVLLVYELENKTFHYFNSLKGEVGELPSEGPTSWNTARFALEFDKGIRKYWEKFLTSYGNLKQELTPKQGPNDCAYWMLGITKVLIERYQNNHLNNPEDWKIKNENELLLPIREERKFYQKLASAELSLL